MHENIAIKNDRTYKDYIQFKIGIIIALIMITALIAIFAISAGSAGLTFKEVISTLIGRGSESSNAIIFGIRLPRIITAIASGIGLAATGCVMQSILRNPLASSCTLGISEGAAFGASFAIIVLGVGLGNKANPYMVSICAFVGAMISTMVILGLSWFRKVTPEMMILCGVALNALFAGGTTLIQCFAPDIKIAAVIFWTFGDLGRTSWNEIGLISMVSIISSVYFMLNSWNYNALQNGENVARGLGVQVSKIRLIGMIICALTASTIVSFVGIISFIGLIAPNVMRRAIGSDYRYLLPASAIMGCILLLFSDTVARLIVAPIILPIGGITSLMGAPLFIYLVFKGVGNR